MRASQPFRVLVAGGGVAGLETLLALHALAGDRVELTLVAPDDEFVYRPLAAEKPYSVGRMRRIPLTDVASAAGADHFPATVEAVRPHERTLATSAGRRFEYDALVLAVGAEPMPRFPNVLTWDDRSESEMLGGLLRDLEEGYSRSVAIVIPRGPGWPLRAYELALFIARQAGGVGPRLETTIVTPEPPPLALLGDRAFEAVSRELEAAGVAAVSAERIRMEREPATVIILEPSGRRLEVDRVLALPALNGRRIVGVPADDGGFLDVDEHCRVRGVHAIWAAGDATAFPLKSGSIATEQADVAAEDVAKSAGVDIEPRAFQPVQESIGGLPAGRYLKAWLGERDEREVRTDLPVTDVPVLTYLQRDLAAGWRGYG